MKNLFETNSRKDRAKAARSLRESTEIAETKHGQSQSITKMQIQTMDHGMGDWDKRMKLPIPKTVSPSALPSELKSYCRTLSRLAVGHMGRLFRRFWPQFGYGVAGSSPNRYRARSKTINASSTDNWMSGGSA
jgi:hypothetical protein